MTQYERKQSMKAYYIPLCCKGRITEVKCAEILDMSCYGVTLLKRRYRQKGNSAFINGHTGRPSPNRKYSDALRKKIALIYHSDWEGSPFAVFHDALEKWYHVSVPYNTLRILLRREGITPPRSWTLKARELHRPRAERAREGELVQMDASEHDWFLNGTKVTLHGGIDDATHKITGLYFCRNECRLGYNEVLRQTWTRFGIPRAYYIDRHSSFVSSSRKKSRTFTQRIEKSRNESTHFTDICRKLDIEIILALSAQGKGRIERLWQTLQGRLPYIFKFLKIDSVARANAFLSSWMDSFNERFNHRASAEGTAWRPIPHALNLDYELSVKFSCRTDCSGRFIFHDCDFILDAPLRASRKFELCLSEQFGIRACMKGRWYPVFLAESFLQDIVSDKMPQVEKDLIQKYLVNDVREWA